jgi:phage gp16-like protein
MKAAIALDADKARRADLAKIHIAKMELRWDEGTYRHVLWEVCAVRSSSELTAAGRQKFLAHIAKCKGQAPARDARPVRKALTGPQKKMWSLWQQLADKGRLTDRSMKALLAFVHRTTQVDRLEWLNGAQEALVIEALKQWLTRREAL